MGGSTGAVHGSHGPDADDVAVRIGPKVEDSLLIAVRSGGLKVEDALSLAVQSGLKSEEEMHALLHEKLLASFNKCNADPKLHEWTRTKDSGCPFSLFKMMASAKKAQAFWRQKRIRRFSGDRAGYNCALRVARLAIGEDGFYLEQAAEGRLPGALAYCLDMYGRHPRPKGLVFKEGCSAPLRAVALISRLPGGDGISIRSHVDDLIVQLHDILFLLPCPSATVALSFTEKSFYVPSEFTGETLYAMVGLDFVNITAPVENLIKKLYCMYEQEEQEKKTMNEQEDEKHHREDELMGQREEREEQQREKQEELRRARAETKKYKHMRREMKEMVREIKKEEMNEEEQKKHGEYDEAYSLLFPPIEESVVQK